ncbi:hypothetical protein E2C01_028767 [Portunus trituberculatus]|uniref:Uncharacterized protein n=1 Tax=Portunus trituberculatus TaxID=210409 RepID=A0A5B7EPL3_PORTR|nr:hypothetical protein [Portunus trituberculatus]
MKRDCFLTHGFGEESLRYVLAHRHYKRGLNEEEFCKNCKKNIERQSCFRWGLGTTADSAGCGATAFNAPEVLVPCSRHPVDWSSLPVLGLYNLDGFPILIKKFAIDLDVLVDSCFKFHQHIANVVQKAGTGTSAECGSMGPLSVSDQEALSGKRTSSAVRIEALAGNTPGTGN